MHSLPTTGSCSSMPASSRLHIPRLMNCWPGRDDRAHAAARQPGAGDVR